MSIVFEKYIIKITKLIKDKIEKECKKYVHESTLFGDDSEKNIRKLEIAHTIRQKQMKEGEIAELMIGKFMGWKLLKNHYSGLDCMKKDNSIIIELKNKYNTMNSSSEKATLDKLAIYRKNNPNTRCILGIINPKKSCKILKEIIIHNGEEIEKIQGQELLDLVFTYKGKNYSNKIVKHIRSILY